MKSFFVAATGQNVGKTTTCLGLISGLLKRHSSVGFFKPIGQEHIETETGLHVDKDVLLFKSHFQLKDPYEEMSPVLFPRGFTRDYLDGKVDHAHLTQKIKRSFANISKRNAITVIEGTGHTGVGSIVELNNAQVASLLKCPVLLIAQGGLGSSFDELMLNYTQCEKYGVPIAGVILNRVLEEKREMISHYMGKALKRWKIPLLGCIPYDSFLSTPTMTDFEILFKTKLLTGFEHRLRHFHHIRLIATPFETFSTLIPNQLIIAPASSDDLLLSTLSREETLEIGLILTGKQPPKETIVEQIRKAKIPMLYAPLSSFVALKMIHAYTTKTRSDDLAKIEEAIAIVEKHIDFDALHSVL